MTESLNQLLKDHQSFFIHQTKEWVEILAQFETRNKYKILDTQGSPLGFIVEKSKGLLGALSRQILHTRRAMEVGVLNTSGQEVLNLNRPFYWFLSTLTVYSQRMKVGSVHRRFSFFYKIYDLKDSSGYRFARIKAPLWHLWTFPIFNPSKIKVGEITKKWGGVMKEVFTDADKFQVQCPPCDINKKATILAAAISIDLDFFEKKK